MSEMGEYAVDAYLMLKENCKAIAYNVRLVDFHSNPEIDVIGTRHETNTVFLCEVKTHLLGLQMRSKADTVKMLRKKHQIHKLFAQARLKGYDVRYMFWAPKVNAEYCEVLHSIPELEAVINEEYSRCIELICQFAKGDAKQTGNEFIRALQIIEHAQ